MGKRIGILILSIIIISCSAKSSDSNKVDGNTKLETKIDDLVANMTIEEKIGQLTLRGTSSRVKGALPDSLKQAVREGKIGAFLNVMNLDYVNELQQIAVEESPKGIPLMFSRDVIHGFKTIFPIPLGLAASWDAETAKNSARVSAVEVSSVGVRWTFSPMLDIARDSRWGRIAESPGEDPFLASVLAKAYVQGYQGDSLNNHTSLAACAKHFIGYGAAIGGRDYNTAIISEPLLRNVYLPPFAAAVNAGAQTIMTSFNEVNGVPASGNTFILDTVLRDELKFDGFVVSDWESVTEMINHGYAADEKHAAELAVNAGLDMEMTSKSYEKYIKVLIEEGKISEDQINFLVKNILRVKFKLGLFETPYVPKNHNGDLYAEDHLNKAEDAAVKSSVLLKNNDILPLKRNVKVAVIGPLASKPHEQLGTWTFDGDETHTVTPIDAFKKSSVNYDFVEGLSYSRDNSTKNFNAAIAAAKASDVILFFGGEEAILSGEAHSRSNTNLPGAQEDLIKALAKTGKPIVLIIMAGRPISISNIINDVDAVLMAWHPGTMGGIAIEKIIFGDAEPGGRLPVTWPITAGQSPIFYNHKSTGRPPKAESFVQMDSIKVGAWQSSLGNTSHYLDIGYEPQFPFGYGLSYTTFEYSDLKLSQNTISNDETLTVSATITNMGNREGEEVVQFYIQDVVGSITRPVRELKGFERILLKSGASQEVTFKISAQDLKFVNNTMKYVVEPGLFNVWIASNASTGLKTSFNYK